MSHVEEMLRGDNQALSRVISMVEKDDPAITEEILGQIHPYLGNAYVVGITGPPGAGKSSLINKMITLMRKDALTVGLVAVDPTSPYCGGAVLGDRIRMQEHYLDEGVFMRSMATRGTKGGLPKTAANVLNLLDASGKDMIIVETVGVGQTDLDIIEMADSTVVVLVPEAGDSIQTMKAGLMEIADIFVVNKADRPGADYLLSELQMMVSQSNKESQWHVPAIATQAINDIGIDDVYSSICEHRRISRLDGRLESRRRRRRREEFVENLERKVCSSLWETIEGDDSLSSYIDLVERGIMDPYSACREVLSAQSLVDKCIEHLKARPE